MSTAVLPNHGACAPPSAISKVWVKLGNFSVGSQFKNRQHSSPLHFLDEKFPFMVIQGNKLINL